MKKLLALAVAAGLSATAMADATLYGQLHASVDALDADGVDSRTSLSSNSSRIGVKGSTELSGGLKAIYRAEWGIDTGTNNKGTFTDRNQVVGVAGGFGAILVGRHDTPHKKIGRMADLFWSTQLGQNRNVTNPGKWDRRLDSMVGYQTPKMGGFQGFIAHYLDPKDTNVDDSVTSVNGIYKAGPLVLGASYASDDVTGGVDNDSARVMASYKFGNAKVVGFYQTEDNAGVDANVTGLGASYKVSSAGTIKGQVYERDDDGNANGETQLVSVGYDHKLGKKTQVYAQYATHDNGGKLGGSGHDESIQSATGDADGFSVGIRHKF